MEPKYRLKKDMPERKAGAILKYDSEWNMYFYENEKTTPLRSDKAFSYGWPAKDVMNNPDWFEKIEEAEFTLSDMERCWDIAHAMGIYDANGYTPIPITYYKSFNEYLVSIKEKNI